MSVAVRALRLVAGLAALAGYAAETARAALGSGSPTPAAGWRTLEGGGVRLSVPGDWGDLERDAGGALVVHNRPRRFRVDGDAVWYSSAIELRIFRGAHMPARNSEAMSATRRIVTLPDGAATIELAVANGVGPSLRALAERVLWSAEPALERNSPVGASRLETTGT